MEPLFLRQNNLIAHFVLSDYDRQFDAFKEIIKSWILTNRCSWSHLHALAWECKITFDNVFSDV